MDWLHSKLLWEEKLEKKGGHKRQKSQKKYLKKKKDKERGQKK